MTQSFNVLILLAGIGSRLQPLTNQMHKALVPIGSKTLLARQIALWKSLGANQFHFVTGYRREEIESLALSLLPREVCIFHHLPTYEIHNNVMSTALAWPSLVQEKLPFLLCDGDLILNQKLAENFLRASTSSATALVDTNLNRLDEEAMKVILNKDGWITDLSKLASVKDSAGEAIGLWRFDHSFAQWFQNHLLAYTQEASHVGKYYEDALVAALRLDPPAFPRLVPTEDLDWVEVDDFKDLERARLLFGND